MSNSLLVVIATLCAAVAPGLFDASATQNLADKPAIQDALVDFGHPVHPQPPAPDHHHLYPDDVTIVKDGTVTFRMHGMGHGIAIYPVSKNTTRAHISEDLCQGAFGPENPTRRLATLPMQLPRCLTRSPTGTARLSSTSLNFRHRDKSTPSRGSSSQQAGFRVYC